MRLRFIAIFLVVFCVMVSPVMAESGLKEPEGVQPSTTVTEVQDVVENDFKSEENLEQVTLTPPEELIETESLSEGVFYQTHIQDLGWQGVVGNGTESGTTGSGLRLEGIRIKLNGITGVTYRTHVQDEGWQNWVSDNAFSGTEGKSRRLEAIAIKLTGDAEGRYDIYYRVHVENFGWLDWTSNGETAGTEGFSYRLEAIQILLVDKGGAAPGDMTAASINADNLKGYTMLQYRAHVKNDGWLSPVTSGEIAGSTGENKRVEALTIQGDDLKKLGAGSGIQYRSHVSDIGWQDWVSDGGISGTTGQARQIEAIQVRLSGRAADYYDVYYRVHSKNFGWFNWAKNGQSAGTEALGMQVEAIEVKLVMKGSLVIDETDCAFLSRSDLQKKANVSYQAHVSDVGWQDWQGLGGLAGTTGQSKSIEAITMTGPSISSDSSIQYQAHVKNIGWEGWKQSGAVAGTVGKNLQMEAFQIELKGKAAMAYDVYYQVHSEDYGWLGWAKNGEWAGTTGGSRRMEALKVILVIKGEAAPGPQENHYIKAEPKPTGYTPETIENFDLICAVVAHEGGISYESALAVMSCVLNRVDSPRWPSTPTAVITQPYQFSSYLDGYYKQYYKKCPAIVEQAVVDCMNGKRSHPYMSFRSYPTAGSVYIGGNYYF